MYLLSQLWNWIKGKAGTVADDVEAKARAEADRLLAEAEAAARAESDRLAAEYGVDLGLSNPDTTTAGAVGTVGPSGGGGGAFEGAARGSTRLRTQATLEASAHDLVGVASGNALAIATASLADVFEAEGLKMDKLPLLDEETTPVPASTSGPAALIGIGLALMALGGRR